MGEPAAEKKVVHLADIHPTSRVHPEARIAGNVKLGPYSKIGKGVEIGEGTEIGPHVVIEGQTTIGRKNKIYHGAIIGAENQIENSSAEAGYVFVGDENIIRENVTILRGSGETRLGNDNFIMAYCHLAQNCQLGNDIVMANATNLAARVTVEDKAVLGGLTVVHRDVRIGKISMVGAHSRLEKDVPPYILVDGIPARVKGINVIGLRRGGVKPGLRKEIKRAYKILYRSDLTRQQAIEVMDQKLDASEEIEHFLRFLRNVQRGICR